MYGAGDDDGVWGLAVRGGGYVVDWTEVVSVGEAVGAKGWDGESRKGFWKCSDGVQGATGRLAVMLISMGVSHADEWMCVLWNALGDGMGG